MASAARTISFPQGMRQVCSRTRTSHLHRLDMSKVGEAQNSTIRRLSAPRCNKCTGWANGDRVDAAVGALCAQTCPEARVDIRNGNRCSCPDLRIQSQQPVAFGAHQQFALREPYLPASISFSQVLLNTLQQHVGRYEKQGKDVCEYL